MRPRSYIRFEPLFSSLPLKWAITPGSEAERVGYFLQEPLCCCDNGFVGPLRAWCNQPQPDEARKLVTAVFLQWLQAWRPGKESEERIRAQQCKGTTTPRPPKHSTHAAASVVRGIGRLWREQGGRNLDRVPSNVHTTITRARALARGMRRARGKRNARSSVQRATSRCAARW